MDKEAYKLYDAIENFDKNLYVLEPRNKFIEYLKSDSVINSYDFKNKLIGMLSTIARQGRAFGVHLILATQRPDSEVLKGQIKNNIDFRICGKSDKILSQIILDNSDGAEKIPKDKQGIFLTNTGVLFKSYYFDDDEW